MKYSFNIVPGCQATEMNQMELSWDELRPHFMKVNRKGAMTLREYQNATDDKRKEDKDGVGFIPCSTIDQNGKRTQSNMDKVYFLVLDIDTGMQLEDVKNRIDSYEAVIHSSYSHSDVKPKWRVVMPLAEPIPAKDICKVFDFFQNRFDNLLDAACGHDPSRLYYMPACPSDAELIFHAEHIEGEFLNAQAILLEPKTSAPVVLSRSGLSTPAIVISGGGVAVGGRNNAAFKLAAKLFNEGLEVDKVTEAVIAQNDKNDPPMDITEVHQIVQSAMKTVTRKSAATFTRVEEVVAEMNRKYAWVEKQSRVYRFQFSDFVAIEQLRQNYANASVLALVDGKERMQTYADAWYRSPERSAYIDVDFVPGGAAIVDNKINLWLGWGVQPVAGDITPWTEFLDYLFAGDLEARKWIEQWIAYPIQHPGAKLMTAAVLWSINQGVGKSMLCDTIGKLYGSYFKTISATELHSQYNGWIGGCQFVLGEENSSSDQRADSNKLKGMITGETIIVNEKYQPMVEMPNCANFMFTSNHSDAFHLEDADRRYFVWEIVAKRMSDKFYSDFINWRDDCGGLSALMHHLQNIDLVGFNPKGNAQVTASKLEMISQSKSEAERWLAESLEDEDSVRLTFGKEIVSLAEMTEVFNIEHHARATTTAMTRAMRRRHSYSSRKISTSRGRRMVMSLINHDRWESADNSEWANEYHKTHLTGIPMVAS